MSWTSRLRIFDMATRQASTVLENSAHIEAPNWHPNGKSLIVNGEGLLYDVELSHPALEAIDTRDLTRLNNDHGISPDGRTLILSNHTEPGQSCIYTQTRGRAPEKITKQTPSWWHGVSPDGGTLAYTAVRDGRFGIWTCPIQGGPETCVIEGPSHYDGPDYSPDGRWIWFNSDRSGQSQLWRVRPDGTELAQMTDDKRVNWFPHPSPDGACVVYLAYPGGTQGHPGGLDVELRVIGAEGGAPDVLIALHGGQGTINVPSWRPGGGAFAFVDYARA